MWLLVVVDASIVPSAALAPRPRPAAEVILLDSRPAAASPPSPPAAAAADNRGKDGGGWIGRNDGEALE